MEILIVRAVGVCLFSEPVTLSFRTGSKTAAALIAARLGFETTAMDPLLQVSSWQEAENQQVPWIILFSKYDKPPLSAGQNDGLLAKDRCGLRVYRHRGINVLLVFGASGESRYYAAMQFFSRFPYMWDVKGRETGELWSKIKTQVQCCGRHAPARRKGV